MRGFDDASDRLFSYVSIEDKLHAKHPLRLIHEVVNDCLSGMSGDFDALDALDALAADGRPSPSGRRLRRSGSCGPCSYRRSIRSGPSVHDGADAVQPALPLICGAFA